MQDLQIRIYEESKNLIAPILESYTAWVLDEAQRRNIRTLYFLARDGYVLRQIAQALCEAKGIKIQCRYLYCSRRALRTPTYHLIGDEAYDLLFLGGYHVSMSSFLERAGISKDEWDVVLAEAEASQTIDIHREIAYAEIGKYREILLRSRTFCTRVMEHSVDAYPATIGYLKQEGLFEQERIGIVDSGWTGSIQRSMRQLLRAEGYTGQVTGFYFGMYTEPKDPADGEYLTWFFSGHTGKQRKVWFCNNLFECLLSAPHGMTVEYGRADSRFVPILGTPPSPQEKQMIDANVNGILAGVKDSIDLGKELRSKKWCAAHLRRLMCYPSRDTAKIYGRFAFCDDITEAYHFSLAGAEQQKLLKNYVVLSRIGRKMRRRSGTERMTELFWPCGTAAFVQSPVKRAWYKANIFLWEWLKYTIQEVRGCQK